MKAKSGNYLPRFRNEFHFSCCAVRSFRKNKLTTQGATMVQPEKCQTCGTTLPPDAPAGVCPRCLLQAGLADSEHETGDDGTRTSNAKQNHDLFDGPATDSEVSRPDAFPSVDTKVRYFGDYELLDEIARGGMGVVFRARQTRLNRMVALKMILSGRLATEADVRRFQTEAESAAQLDHSGIVPVFEVGQHDGHHFYSMALVEGDSLAEKIAERPLTPAAAAELLKKIAVAVAYAHEKGVIHRDLKPSNVLIDQAGDPRVTDFGLAKKTAVESSLTRSGQTLGTPSFMAPEQASGKSDQVSESADIYALGAILFCALTGRPPFVADTAAKTLWQLSHDDPPFPRKLNADIPADLEAICLKCLEKSPARRYDSASDLHDDLSRFLNHQSVQARRATMTSRALRWSRRNRRSIVMVVATSAAVLLAVAGIQRARKWYGRYRTGHVSISTASGPTEIGLYRQGNSAPERTLTVATDETIELPSGNYEIWVERYGQRWRANVLSQQTLPLSLRDDDRHEYSLRTAGYLANAELTVPIRRQGRTDLLTEASLHVQDENQRTLELHHGWNGDRLWGVEIASWETWRETHAEDKSSFIDLGGGAITSDIDGDGAADIAALKANHYLVLSSETGEVILDAPIEYESRFKRAKVSFGEFMDVNQDETLDVVLCIGGDWLALDGRDGREMWRTTINGSINRRFGGRLIASANNVPMHILGEGFQGESGLLRIYSLSSGELLRESEIRSVQLQPLGVVDGAEEPLVVVMLDKEIQAIGVLSGQVAWSVAAEDWQGFSVQDQSAGFTRRGTVVLEDLTGDGVTDVVMAERRVAGTPAIELMMIDGRKGQTLWQSKLQASGRLLSWAPAVDGEPASEPGKIGRLFCVDVETAPDAVLSTLRLNSLNPMTGDILWRSSLPMTTTHGAALHQSLDNSRLPVLLVESGGDLYKRNLLQVDKETGAPVRRVLLDRSTPVLMLADMNQDGLADLLTGERVDSSVTGGVARVDVSVYQGRPRECWRRPVESFPLSDVDGDGISDCLALGIAPAVVSGADGQTLEQYSAVRYEASRTMVTTGSSDGVIAQLAEEGHGELSTFVRAIDASSGDVIAEINDHVEGYWGPAVSRNWSKLYFPDLDADGHPEIAITGNRPWRVYASKTRKRLLLGSGLTRTADPQTRPAALIGYFKGNDGRDRLIEVGADTRYRREITVRALDGQGRREWSSGLQLKDSFEGDPSTAGVRTADFDGDGIEDLIIAWGSNLWILEQDTGGVKLHTNRIGQIGASAAFMVRTKNGLPVLAVPYRKLIYPDGKVETNAYEDVIKHPDPRGSGEIYVWIRDDGRIVALGPDGTTHLWEHRLPKTGRTKALGKFLHDGDWNGAVVVRRGYELFAMDLLTGRKLWRSSIKSSDPQRIRLLQRKQYSTPLILSSSENVTVCRETHPVDNQWNYLLPSPISAESPKARRDQPSSQK